MRYTLTNHCCRHCRGRILRSDDGVYVCAECGLITDTDDDSGEHNVEDICACGLVLKDGRDARFRCRVIPPEERTEESPYMLGVTRV